MYSPNNQNPILPQEGDYIAQIEQIEPRLGVNGKMHTTIHLKTIENPQILLLILYANRLIEWNYIAKQKVNIKVRVKHKILNYKYSEILVADIQLREIIPC